MLSVKIIRNYGLKQTIKIQRFKQIRSLYVDFKGWKWGVIGGFKYYYSFIVEVFLDEKGYEIVGQGCKGSELLCGKKLG